jgi:cytochrome c biogenesis protein CcdA
MVRVQQSEATSSDTVARLLRALVISLAVTGGFVLLFGSIGVAITAGAQLLNKVIPWVGLVIGILLTLLGLWLLASRNKLYVGMAQRMSARISLSGRNKIVSFFLFGIAYALASFACAFPTFSIAVTSSLTKGNYVSGLGEFLAYSLGMGLVLTVLTLAMAIFKGAAVRKVRAVMPVVERVSPAVVTLAGLFIVYYWVSIGQLGPDALQVGFLNKIVEGALGSATNSLTASIPFYSLGAGMLATVNPCGFALLPAYLSLYLSGEDTR